MMPSSYLSKTGVTIKFDLDAVFDVVKGQSAIKENWNALIIFVPSTNSFVELRDSPQDYRGNSASEAEEVDPIYIKNTFFLSELQLAAFKANPKKWQFIDQRKQNHEHT